MLRFVAFSIVGTYVCCDVWFMRFGRRWRFVIVANLCYSALGAMRLLPTYVTAPSEIVHFK